MRRKTVREWINFIGIDDENQLYGVQMEDGLTCKPMNYQPMKIFFSIYSGYLNDIVINIYPKNFEKDGKNYCLFITEKEEPFDYMNKTEKEILEQIFKKAERRDDIHIQENRKDFIEILDSCEDNGIGLIFNEEGELSSVESEY